MPEKLIKTHAIQYMPKHKIHIGSLIQSKLKEDGRSAAWLAQKIGCERGNMYKIFDKSSIDTEQLLSISLAIGENFFDYYADTYQNSIKKEKET